MKLLKLFNERRENSTKNKIAVVILIVVISIYTFTKSVENELDRTSQVTPTNLMAVSIAISEMKYGLTGYTGYTNILKIFLEDLGIFPVSGFDIYNNKIKKALSYDSFNNLKSGGLHLIWNDVGMVNYFKLAFKLFGYKIQSLFYLYFLLFTVSLCFFIVTFSSQIRLLNILLLFVCSHFVIVMATTIAGGELQVSNVRFFPVLTILPTFYITLLILGEHKINLLTISGTIIQTAILILIISVRSSAAYQLMFLLCISFLAFLWYWKRMKRFKEALIKIQFLPLAIVFIAFLLLKLHLVTGLHPLYDTARHKHHFWGAAIVGLSAHPDSESKYGITYSDKCFHDAIQRRAAELGYHFNTDINIQKAVQASQIEKEEFIYTNGLKTYQTTLSSVKGGQSGNCLKITASDNTTGYAYLTVPTQVGRKYRFSGYYKKGSAANGQIKVGTTVDAADLYYSGTLSNSVWTRHSDVFTATTTETYITFENLTSTNGQTSFFDSVSIEPVGVDKIFKFLFDKALGKKDRDDYTYTNGLKAHLSTLSSANGGQSGNCLKITASDNNTAFAYLTIPTQIGRTYKFSGYYKKGSAANGQIKIGTSKDATNLYYSGVLSNTDWTRYSEVFTATAPNAYITLVNLTSKKGQNSFFDTVILEPVNDGKREVFTCLFEQDLGVAKKEMPYVSSLFDTFAKDEFIKILKADPWFVLVSYFYKIPLFLKVYFCSSGHEYYRFGATKYMFNWCILVAIASGFLLTRKHFDRKWFLYSSILALQFIFSLSPSILLIPVSHHISEPALFFTIIIYLVFSVILCYILDKFSKAYKKTRIPKLKEGK
ncbi:MAG: hypothetical protein GY928_07375 [Colwellia sp.]|nr:hypothetical protein [Colwellia sp.]